MLKFMRSWSGEQVRVASDRVSMNRTYVVIIYSVLGFLAASIIGSLHIIVEGNTLLGYLEIIIGLVFVLNAIGMKLTGNDAVAARFFLSTLVVLFIVMLVTGGTQGTGVFWIPFFPLAAFFLMRREEGLYWAILLFGVIGIMTLLDTTNAVDVYYTPIAMRQLLASLAVVTVGVYIYEGVQEAALRMARQLDKAKSEFLTLASHQLRTPISGIKWMSEILLASEDDPLSKAQRQQIEQIYESNQRLAHLVDSMLIVSSLELGTLPMRPEPLDLPSVTGRAVEGALASAGKHINFKQRYDKDLPKVVFDSHVLQIILENLAANSVKYTPEGGSVSLEVTRTPEKFFPASKGSVAIILSDSGYGIPEDAKSRIFTKFFRADNIKNKDTDGTGLGLHIVKELLNYTGGRISFDSHEGSGTTFVVVLPIEGTLQSTGRRANNGLL